MPSIRMEIENSHGKKEMMAGTGSPVIGSDEASSVVSEREVKI